MNDHIDFTLHENQFDDANTSNNPEFSDIIQTRINRRTVIKGSAGITAAAFLGMSITGCGGSDSDSGSGDGNGTDSAAAKRPNELKFSAVQHSKDDIVKVPKGYKVEILAPLGEPLAADVSAYKNDGNNTPESFMMRAGDNHDGMWLFGKNGNKFDATQSDNGIMCVNHEYCENQYLNPNGYVTTKDAADEGTIYEKRRSADDVRRGVNAHGVAVYEVKRKSNSNGYEIVMGNFNRRFTSLTETDISGPAAGSDYFKTKYDATGKKTRGINNQCGAGRSPWGTFLTVEENFRGVFGRGDDKSKLSTNEHNARLRYGLPEGETGWGYLWWTPKDKEAQPGEFLRWNATATGSKATDDYRNAFNKFGYIVEIDPFNPTSKAVKRTALGRFAHENCGFAPVETGKPVVFYMGDDSRGEYIYKFVSEAKWDPKDIGKGLTAGAKYMDKGTLYVAVFNEDGSGEWKELALGKNGINKDFANFSFTKPEEISIFTRFAADAAGGTKMDRPEWIDVNPLTKEVYCTLTKNGKKVNKTDAKASRVWDGDISVKKLRSAIPTDAANPRSYGSGGNRNGHIIRWKEEGDNHAATTFTWDIYMLATPYELEDNNLSKLNANNDFSSPDGLFFDARGVLWIQTDDSRYLDKTNCMLLAALPGTVSERKQVTTSSGQKTWLGAVATDANIKRFLVSPKEAEITGITMSADYKTLFINVQHPGEKGVRSGTPPLKKDSPKEPTSHWPATQSDATNKTAMPRSATVVITREDGKEILSESM